MGGVYHNAACLGVWSRDAYMRLESGDRSRDAYMRLV